MEAAKQGGVIAYICSSHSAPSPDSFMNDSSASESPSSSPPPPSSKAKRVSEALKHTHPRGHSSAKSTITKLNGMVLLCKVCGDVASGFHYGVHACEGCKGFFRRSIQQNIQYKKCLKTESCTIVRINRNRCQQCRFKKCLSVGMSRDAVRFGRIPKREKQRMLLEMQTAMNNMMNSGQLQNIMHSSPSPPDSPRSSSDLSESTVAMDTASSCSSDSGEEDSSASLTCPETLSRGRKEDEEPQQESWSSAGAYREQMNQNEYSNYDRNNMNDTQTAGNRGHLVCPMNSSPFVYPSQTAHEIWEDFSRSFVPAVREVVEFAKGIPGFLELSQHDQVSLLKAGTFEVLMVRFVSLFDVSERTVSFLSGRKYSVDLLRSMGAGELLSCMFEFSEKLTALSLSTEEISLFTAVVLVSADRSAIENVSGVEALQETLIRALRSLIMKNHSNEAAVFTKLLLRLPELRSLNNMHSEELLAFKIQS